MDQITNLTTYLMALFATDVRESTGGIYLPTDLSAGEHVFHPVPHVSREDQCEFGFMITDPFGATRHYHVNLKEVGL